MLDDAENARLFCQKCAMVMKYGRKLELLRSGGLEKYLLTLDRETKQICPTKTPGQIFQSREISNPKNKSQPIMLPQRDRRCTLQQRWFECDQATV